MLVWPRQGGLRGCTLHGIHRFKLRKWEWFIYWMKVYFFYIDTNLEDMFGKTFAMEQMFNVHRFPMLLVFLFFLQVCDWACGTMTFTDMGR